MSDIVSSAAYKPQQEPHEQQQQPQQQQPARDELEDIQSALQAQGAAPLEQPGDNNTNQQLLLQNILQTYGQAGAQPAVRVPLRPAALHADIIGLNGNLNTIFQTLNGQVVSALPQFIAAQPTLSNAQAVLALQQQQQQQQQASDPDNSTQLAALLAAMEDPSSRYVPGRAALQALGVADGKISKVQGAAASLAAASPAAVAAAITAAAGGAASFAAAAGATMLAGGGGGAVSDGGGEVYGGGSQATTREKNRQAQQRFRQRQKDRIVELEAENGALQEQLADARQEVLLLRAKLEEQAALLGSAQQAQQQQQQQDQDQQQQQEEEQ